MKTFTFTTTQLIIGGIVLAIILFFTFRFLYKKGEKDALVKELELVDNALANTSVQRNPGGHEKLLLKRMAILNLLQTK